MSARQIGAILLGIALLATLGGCNGQKKLVQEIAAQRKSGDAAGARQQAVDLLTEKADRMEVWREWAYCDEALYREMGHKDADRLVFLVEASLLCAAICGQNDGQAPDSRWGAICTLVSGHLQTCRSSTLETVKTHAVYQRESTFTHPYFSQDDLSDPLYSGPPQTFAWTEADPAEAQAALFRYARLLSLAQRLPHAVAVTDSRDVVIRDIQNWAEHCNLSIPTAVGLYESGEAAVTKAYTQALADLHEPGYFLTSTILQNAILEP